VRACVPAEVREQTVPVVGACGDHDMNGLDVLQLDRRQIGSKSVVAQAYRDDGHRLPGGDELELVLNGVHHRAPVVAIGPGEATEHFGWLAHFVTIDNPTSSALTRQRFGWNPVQPGLIEDVDANYS
jgi:hypothetical protein